MPAFLLSHSLPTKQRRRPQKNPPNPLRPPTRPMNKAALPPFPRPLFPACYTECVLLAEPVMDVGLPLSLCPPDKDTHTHADTHRGKRANTTCALAKHTPTIVLNILHTMSRNSLFRGLSIHPRPAASASASTPTPTPTPTLILTPLVGSRSEDPCERHKKEVFNPS